MANLNVTYEEMRTTAGQLVQGKDEIQQRLSELQNAVDRLVASGYSTDLSGPAFQDQYNNFTTGTKQAVDALEGLSKFLISAADALQSTDESLANALNGN